MHLSAALPAALAALSLAPTALSVINYANDFIDPSYILDFKYDKKTAPAQQTVIQWANQLAQVAPWSVTTKTHLAPSGDIHDYMSWRPYFWPDCSAVGNTTVLSIDEMFKECNYTVHDGLLNPDARLINNVGDFDDMASAILFNALSWGVTRSSIYAVRVVGYVEHWFLNERTMMNPNLNYAQLKGGPDGQNGTHTGVLDLKAMVKIASGVLLLREGNAPQWNSTVDAKFQAWCKEYIDWLVNSPIAKGERDAQNNHGTFYFAQLASLYLITNDKAKAAALCKGYFSSTFKIQIKADGDQPLEHDRTRPFHYLTYNLAGIITVGRIAEYVGYNAWNETSAEGATIPKALEYVMNFPVGTETLSELFPVVAAIASIYGDPDNKYADWLNQKSKGQYVEDGSFLWNQPLSDNNLAKAEYITYAAAVGGTQTLAAGARPTADTAESSSASTLAVPWLALGVTLSAWLL